MHQQADPSDDSYPYFSADSLPDDGSWRTSSPPPAERECRMSGLLVWHTSLVRPVHRLFRPIIADQIAFPIRSWVSPLARDDRQTELPPYIKSAGHVFGRESKHRTFSTSSCRRTTRGRLPTLSPASSSKPPFYTTPQTLESFCRCTRFSTRRFRRRKARRLSCLP
jgi:hypothetical protein